MHVTTGYIDVNIRRTWKLGSSKIAYSSRFVLVLYSHIGGSSPSCCEGPSLQFWVRARPEGPKPSEAQTADGWGFGGGHWLRGLGDRCKLPQWGPGRSRGREKVLLHSRGTRWPLLELVGAQFGGPVAPFGPLKSACDESRREFGIFARLVRQPRGVTLQSLI